MIKIRAYILLTFIFFVPKLSHSESNRHPLEEIATASIQDLMNIPVTTVSRVPEELLKASAAVSVVTSEDIRRSGATSVQEVLRRVPGVNVARREANKWAISIRGLNSRTSNRILVLVDGRSIYDPAFSGTLWETRDIYLEDIDRIEVIRGPGGSTWGSNAMNGVINILTKSAADTQGTLISAGGGTEEKAFSTVRYGGKISEDTFYRVYGRYFDRDNGYLEQGASDDSYNGQTGFRLDSKLKNRDNLMLAGNLYQGEHDGVTGTFESSRGKGATLQGRWEREINKDSELLLYGFYDHTDLDAGLLAQRRNTAELNAQNSYRLYEWFELISALQYRITEDEIYASEVAAVSPPEREDSLFSGALTGKFRLIPDKLDLRLGAKVEHNDYSDLEVQPDFGLSYSIDSRNTIWTSASHAVRIPSRLESDLVVKEPTTGSTVFSGNRNLDSERVMTYQLGYRTNPRENLLSGITFFYNSYDDMASVEGTTFTNNIKGESYGLEVGSRWEAKSWWSLYGSYSLLMSDFEGDSNSVVSPSQTGALEGSSPDHQFYFSSQFNLGEKWEFDLILRYVDVLSFPRVDSYLVSDMRLGYRILKNLELAVIGQNLFDSAHFEQSGSQAAQVQQGVYTKVTWNF